MYLLDHVLYCKALRDGESSKTFAWTHRFRVKALQNQFDRALKLASSPRLERLWGKNQIVDSQVDFIRMVEHLCDTSPIFYISFHMINILLLIFASNGKIK